MKSTLFALMACVAFFVVLPPGPRADSLYSDDPGVDLYHKKPREYKTGDIILVKIEENSLAQSQATTGLSGEHKTDVSFTNTGILDAVLSPLWRLLGLGGKLSEDTKNTYDGKGDTDRKGKLSATVSVLVVDILENGNLVIEGRKEVKVNHENQILVVSGEIRPQDVSEDNTVLSERIADTKVEYIGEGQLTKKLKPGFISKIFDLVF